MSRDCLAISRHRFKSHGQRQMTKDLWLILTIDLSLPDGVGDAPQRRQDEEDVVLVGVRHPVEQDSNDDDVEAGAEDEDGDAAEDLDDGAEAHREDGVAHAVGDHHVADVVHAPTASDVSLEKCFKHFRFFVRYKRVNFLLCRFFISTQQKVDTFVPYQIFTDPLTTCQYFFLLNLARV